MRKVREAVSYAENGDPVKDVIDEWEMVEAIILLVRIIDNK